METISYKSQNLKIESMGNQRWAYYHPMGSFPAGVGGYCCTVVGEEIIDGVKILTMCDEPLYLPAINVSLMGCMVRCKCHLQESYKTMTVDEAIEKKREYNRADAAGEFRCDVCGAMGAHHVAGEGQTLCPKCNYRDGINAWS